MSGVEALVVVGIIANVLALVDFSSKVLSRVDDFKGKVKDVPKAFRNLKIVLPLLADTLSRTKSRIDALEVDDTTCAALRPKDGATRLEIRWKAISSVKQDKKVQEISVVQRRCCQLLHRFRI